MPSKTPLSTAQNKVASLVTDLAAKASSASLVSGLASKQDAIVDGGLAQSKVANLVTDLAATASSASFVSGLATKQDTIADGGLAQSKVANLVSDLAGKASAASLVTGLAAKQDALSSQSNIAVDTISSRLYLGDVFRFWRADQSSALVTFGTSALGAEFSMPIRTPQMYFHKQSYM